MTKLVTVETHVFMDYPKESEVLNSSNYTLRFTASDETRSVEVSIDGGPWQECRKANGHFWFDWANYMSGRHEIVARARLFNGSIEEAGGRLIRVEIR
jgi:hypothetical protein